MERGAGAAGPIIYRQMLLRQPTSLNIHGVPPGTSAPIGHHPAPSGSPGQGPGRRENSQACCTEPIGPWTAGSREKTGRLGGADRPAFRGSAASASREPLGAMSCDRSLPFPEPIFSRQSAATGRRGGSLRTALNTYFGWITTTPRRCR